MALKELTGGWWTEYLPSCDWSEDGAYDGASFDYYTPLGVIVEALTERAACVDVDLTDFFMVSTTNHYNGFQRYELLKQIQQATWLVVPKFMDLSGSLYKLPSARGFYYISSDFRYGLYYMKNMDNDFYLSSGSSYMWLPDNYTSYANEEDNVLPNFLSSCQYWLNRCRYVNANPYSFYKHEGERKLKWEKTHWDDIPSSYGGLSDNTEYTWENGKMFSKLSGEWHTIEELLNRDYNYYLSGDLTKYSGDLPYMVYLDEYYTYFSEEDWHKDLYTYYDDRQIPSVRRCEVPHCREEYSYGNKTTVPKQIIGKNPTSRYCDYYMVITDPGVLPVPVRTKGPSIDTVEHYSDTRPFEWLTGYIEFDDRKRPSGSPKYRVKKRNPFDHSVYSGTQYENIIYRKYVLSSYLSCDQILRKYTFKSIQEEEEEWWQSWTNETIITHRFDDYTPDYFLQLSTVKDRQGGGGYDQWHDDTVVYDVQPAKKYNFDVDQIAKPKMIKEKVEPYSSFEIWSLSANGFPLIPTQDYLLKMWDQGTGIVFPHDDYEDKDMLGMDYSFARYSSTASNINTIMDFGPYFKYKPTEL